MRISSVEIRQVEVPYGPDGYRPTWLPNVTQHIFPQTVVRVISENGKEGFASTNCFGKEVFEFGRLVAPLLLGRELNSKEQLNATWDTIKREATDEGPSQLLSVVAREAISGDSGRDISWFGVLSDLVGQLSSINLLKTKNILLENRPWVFDCALWDLLGKEKGKPVCDLLGRTKDKIKAYVSTGELVDEEMEEFAVDCRDRGFEMIKLRAHRYPDFQNDLDHIESIQDRVGDDMEVGVDANQNWSVLPPYWSRDTAMEVATKLDEMDIAWLEEPLGGLDVEGIAELSNAVDLPIVGGELEHGRDHFNELNEAYDIINPDIVMSVGISDGLRIARDAAEKGTGFTPHTWDLGPGVAAGLHLACAIENCHKLEYPYDPSWPVEYRDSILQEPIEAEDGYLNVPDRPGLGIAPDMETIQDHTTDRFALGPDVKFRD